MAEGANGDDISRLVEHHHPDLVLLDLRMNYGDGTRVNVIREIFTIRRLSPSTNIVIVSAYLNDKIIHALFNKEISGYLSKDDIESARLPSLLIQAINGTKIISPKVQAYFQNRKNANIPKLTPRQVEILIQLAKESELSYEEIAENLDIREQSLKNQLTKIYAAFGVSNRTSCILRGIEFKYLRPEQWSSQQDIWNNYDFE